jgi:outer membrane protein assembly factor BamB
MRSHHARAAVLSVASLVIPALAGVARGEWPQWRGPNRDGVSTETGLMKSWPEGGPPRVWLFENCGLGYSAPAIVGSRLYMMGARENEEQLIAIDAKTGNELWQAPIGEMLENNWGNGPRGTPTVDGDLIYALGAQGNLVCVNSGNGLVVWTRAMKDFGGKVPTWGFSESPLVYEDKLLCTPGGENGAIVALDKKTGKELWQTTEITTGAHYSSIVKADRAAGPECVQLLADQVLGFNPTDGKVLWSHPWPGEVAVIPTPIVKDNLVYVTTSYGVGCMLVQVGDDHSVSKVYDNKTMKNKHGGVILLGDHVYGHSDDVGWVCQELKTGERVWREREALGKGSIAYADSRFYCLGEDEGDVVLIDASTEGWKEHGRFKLAPQTKQRKPAGKIWTHPVICDGKLYLRDQDLLFCFDVREGAGGSPAASK